MACDVGVQVRVQVEAWTPNTQKHTYQAKFSFHHLLWRQQNVNTTSEHDTEKSYGQKIILTILKCINSGKINVEKWCIGAMTYAGCYKIWATSADGPLTYLWTTNMWFNNKCGNIWSAFKCSWCFLHPNSWNTSTVTTS